MSIFLSGGGGGGDGGLCGRPGGAGCAGLWIWAYAHYFSYLRLLERIFLLLILSFWFILKKKENFLFGAGFQATIFLSFPSFFENSEHTFLAMLTSPPFYAILRAFYAKKFSQYMLIFLFVSMATFPHISRGAFPHISRGASPLPPVIISQQKFFYDVIQYCRILHISFKSID